MGENKFLTNSIVYYPFNPLHDDIVEYSYKLSRHLHEGEERQNGRPYFEAHSVPIVERFKQLQFHPSLKEIFFSMCYLHDVIENNLYVKIRSPFDSFHLDDEYTINRLFQPAGKIGTKILYGVNRLTDKFSNKFEYMDSLLNISASHTWRNLDIGILAIKACDLWENNRDPHETYRLKNDSQKEHEKAKKFKAKKLRRGLELKYHYLTRIESTLLSCSDIEINSEPLFNAQALKSLMEDINTGFEEFLRYNPPMEIVMSNNGIGDVDRRKLSFYTMAFRRLAEDYKKYFNYYKPEPLTQFMHEKIFLQL